jgi:hypothetical protein
MSGSDAVESNTGIFVAGYINNTKVAMKYRNIPGSDNPQRGYGYLYSKNMNMGYVNRNQTRPDYGKEFGTPVELGSEKHDRIIGFGGHLISEEYDSENSVYNTVRKTLGDVLESTKTPTSLAYGITFAVYRKYIKGEETRGEGSMFYLSKIMDEESYNSIMKHPKDIRGKKIHKLVKELMGIDVAKNLLSATEIKRVGFASTSESYKKMWEID